MMIILIAFISDSAAHSFALITRYRHRHPHRQAVCHLRQDPALRAVGDVALDFDAAVHRAGVHDEDVLLAALEAVPGQAEQAA